MSPDTLCREEVESARTRRVEINRFKFTGPHLSAVSGGKPSNPSSDAGRAKMEGAESTVPGRVQGGAQSLRAATNHPREA